MFDYQMPDYAKYLLAYGFTSYIPKKNGRKKFYRKQVENVQVTVYRNGKGGLTVKGIHDDSIESWKYDISDLKYLTRAINTVVRKFDYHNH